MIKAACREAESGAPRHAAATAPRSVRREAGYMKTEKGASSKIFLAGLGLAYS